MEINELYSLAIPIPIYINIEQLIKPKDTVSII